MTKKPLTLKRVLAAAKRDDGSGFCTSCGAGAKGVEPDAHGYKCSKCGALAVTGAEDLLIDMA